MKCKLPELMRFLFPVVILSILLSCHTVEHEKPDVDRVLLICLDTFRYDHMTPDITPNIVGLAAESHNYTNCRSVASWTLPSITSVFTGKFPSRAGVLVKSDVMSDDQITLAEVLSDNGWKTYAWTANSVISEERNFDQGFDIYELHTGIAAGKLIDMALEKFLENTESETFFYLHFMEPHRPYKPAPKFRDRFSKGEGRFSEKFDRGNELLDGEITISDGEMEQLRGLYEAECAWADFEIGRLIQTLKKKNLWETTAVIFFADHGEEFYENGEWFHGNNLYEETVHVPFMIKFPGESPAVIDELTSLRSIGQRIFEGIGLDVPPDFTVDDTWYMEGVDRGEELKGLISDDFYKLIFGTETGTLELYDLRNDPDEENNLMGSEEEVALELTKKVLAIYENTPDTGSGESELTPEMEEQLRALGYIH